MQQPTFKIVFEGEIKPGESLNDVKDRLATLFRADKKRIDALFATSPLVLKAHLDRDKALRYLAVLERVGMVCRIEQEKPEFRFSLQPMELADISLRTDALNAIADFSLNTVLEYSEKITDKRIFFTPDIPPAKLRNAVEAYAPDAKYEQRLVLIDNTLWGSAKKGALLTDKKIYAQNASQPPLSFNLNQIRSIKFVEGSPGELYINDRKFLAAGYLDARVIHLVADMLKALLQRPG